MPRLFIPVVGPVHVVHLAIGPCGNFACSRTVSEVARSLRRMVSNCASPRAVVEANGQSKIASKNVHRAGLYFIARVPLIDGLTANRPNSSSRSKSADEAGNESKPAKAGYVFSTTSHKPSVLRISLILLCKWR